MGAFYGSVHVRSEHAAGVRQALEELAGKNGTRFLLGPLSGGWIGVYPSDHGQDISVSAAIAAHISAPVLHLLVHDDSVFAYQLHAGGGLIDEYCSDPDYFESSPVPRWDETAGRPEALAALNGSDSAGLKAALDRKGMEGKPFRATWQLERVAELLGIVNAETSYEYLRQGETRGIRGWKDFVHIPDLSAEKEAKRRRQAEVTATTRRLQKEGRLLVSEKRRGTGQYGFPPRPIFCAHPTEGFLLTWSDPGASAAASVEWRRAPWNGPAETGVSVNSKVHRMKVSPSGRFLGVGYASGEWSAQLFDLANRRLLTTVPLPRANEHLSFSSDDRTMICRSQGELRIIPTDEGHSVMSIVVGPGRSATVHPGGRWLVADVQGGGSIGLAIVDLQGGSKVRILPTAKVDIAALVAGHTAGQDVTLLQQEIPWKVEFTPDGRLLIVLVQVGIRVYSWDEVLRSQDSLPTPLVGALTGLVQTDSIAQRHTYGLAVNQSGSVALFSGLDGLVRSLDIQTGRSEPVIEVPGAPPVIELARAKDGATVALGIEPGMFSRGAKRPAPVWQVWNLEKGLAY